MQREKLKIVFCTPPLKRRRGAFEIFSAGGSSFPSAGLLILASIARKQGHKVLFRDFLNTGKEQDAAIEEVLGLKVDLVGISSNTDTIFQAQELASGVKQVRKDVVTLIGGPHISAVPVETMKCCRDFDIGFIGEAEQSFSILVNSDFSIDSLRRIKGICFRSGENIIVNERQPFIFNLDNLPFPAWDLIEDIRIYRPAVTNFKREPVFSLMTSRGCFGRCIFCDRGVFGNRVRMHSADYVIRMVRQLRQKYGIKEIIFYDDNMVFNKRRLKEICSLILKESNHLNWSCSARVDIVDKETLRMMKNAGCWQISYGIESGSQEILNTLRKGITVDKIRKTAGLMREIGLSMRGYFIIGNPGESLKTLKETLNLIRELPLDDILVEYMTPYPGTELYNNVRQYGTMLGDWSILNSYDMNFIPQGMDEECLKSYFFRFYKYFYLRPRIILNYTKRLKNPLKMADLAVNYLKFAIAHRR